MGATTYREVVMEGLVRQMVEAVDSLAVVQMDTDQGRRSTFLAIESISRVVRRLALNAQVKEEIGRGESPSDVARRLRGEISEPAGGLEVYGIEAGDIIRNKATGEAFQARPVDDQPVEPDEIVAEVVLHLADTQTLSWVAPGVRKPDGLYRIDLCKRVENNAPAGAP